MGNHIIDVPHNVDTKDITAESGGAVSNDVRVTIRQGVTKQEAHKALLGISNALIGDQVKLD
jgi:hypothetical protein